MCDAICTPSDSKTGSVGPFSCFGSTGKQGPGLPGSPLSAADRPVWFRIWFFRLISSVPHWVRRDQVKKRHWDPFRPKSCNPYPVTGPDRIGVTPTRPNELRIWFFRLISSVPHWVRRDQVKKPDQNRFRPFRRWIGVITPILDALSPAPLYK